MVLEFIELEYHGKILKIFYGTRVNSSTIKNFQNFSEYNFSKNSSFWNSSFTANSSFKKVIDPYIFPKR